jgi:hypothetical protein
MKDLLPVAIIVIFCISYLCRVSIDVNIESGAKFDGALKDTYNALTVSQYVCVCFLGFELIDIIFKYYASQPI